MAKKKQILTEDAFNANGNATVEITEEKVEEVENEDDKSEIKEKVETVKMTSKKAESTKSTNNITKRYDEEYYM